MKKIAVIFISLLFLIPLISCDKPNNDAPYNYPEDFRFSLTWNTYGTSSYDSTTGKLVKTTDATNPEDYVTELHFTPEQIQAVYEAVSALDLDSYPDSPVNYDPCPGVISKPSQTVIISFSYGDVNKTIRAKGIAIAAEATTDAGRKFFAVRDVIVDIIYQSAEWQALPDYEVLYD